MAQPNRWADLEPDQEMLQALDKADADGARALAIASKIRTPKHSWSNRFADACAQMVASEVARCRTFAKFDVHPKPEGPAEPVVFPVGGERKKVDVVVSERAQGLQVGISLKGMNFRDHSGLQFDKNLTGRTYELENEVRGIHRGLPLAFIVGLYFLPIAATDDERSSSAQSTFAHTVAHLRSRVGRTDPHSPTQMERLDMAIVALYVPGDHEEFTYETGTGKSRKEVAFSYIDALARGVVRYFDVTRNPPLRGRPKLETTLSLSDLVSEIARRYVEFTQGHPIDWAEPEAD